MQPAPIPPTGIAIWTARSPVKLCWGPLAKSSSEEYGSASETGVLGESAAGESGRLPDKETAAPRAAEELVIKNSLRLGLSKGDVEPPLPNQGERGNCFKVTV